MDADRELDLVKRAQMGDRDSYGRLIDHYGGVVLAIAYSRVGNYTVAQDIAQDAFLLGLEHLVSLRKPHRFGSWLKTITANLCNRWHKSQAYRERLMADSAIVRKGLGYAGASEAEEKMERKEIHRLLDETLENVPVRDRESIMLYYFEGKSIDDAASALGISRAAMKKRLERARGRLRDELNAHVESGLVEAARGRRRMSARALAALPAGASFAKVAPTASVLPSAPLLHLTGMLSTMGGTVMGVNKAAIIGAICAAAIIAGSALYMTRGATPSEEPPAEPVRLGQSLSQEEPDPEPAAPETAQQSEPSAEQVVAATEETEEPAAPPPKRENGDCVLYGTVTDPDGDPGRNVRILVARTHYLEGEEDQDKPAIETETLYDGSYRAESLPEGRYVVYALAPGASGVELVFVSRDGSLETRQDIQMSPSFATSGTVRNAEDERVPDATVVLLARKDVSVDPAVFKPMAVKTDENGRYVLDYIWEGSYTIEASAEGYAPSVLSGVRAGTERNNVVLSSGVSVSGKVTFKNTGEPAPGVLVTARNVEGGTGRGTHTDTAGMYLVENLSRDTKYTITVEDESYVAVEKRTVSLGDEKRVTGVDIVLSAGASISGTVTASDTGEPLPGANINVSGPKRRETSSNADGTYLCSGLLPGRYQVWCEPPEGVGRTYDPPRQMSVGRDEQLTGIDFSFERGATISGRVTDATMNGIEGAILQGYAQAKGRYSLSEARTDTHGNYRLTGVLRNSKCRIFVKSDQHGIAYSDVTPVPTEGEVTGIDFVLGPGASVSGRVVDTNGRYMHNAWLKLTGADRTSRLWETAPYETDEAGRFEMSGIGPGTYQFEVGFGSRGHYRKTLSDPVTVTAEERITGVEVVVEAVGQGVVAGRVRDDSGNGVYGVQVDVRIATGSRPGTQTDASGHYRFENLADGKVRLDFSHENYVSESIKDVPVGTMDADVVMTRRGSVAGVVRDAATRVPITDFSVETGRHGYWLGFAKGFQSEVGEFLMENVSPGEVTLKASAAGYAPQEIPDILVQSGQTTTGIEFYLCKGDIVRGMVVAASDARPVAGANIYLGGIPEDPLVRERNAIAVTSADGSFVLKDLAAGEQTVGVRHPEFATATAVVTVREGEENQVTIRLGPAGIVAGHVSENDVAVSGATLFLNGSGTDHRYHDRGRTDIDGYYRFQGLAAGTYRVSAYLPTPVTGELGQTQGATVEVQEGSVTEKSFEFRSGTGVIEGFVVRHGEPVGGCSGRVHVSYAWDIGQLSGRASVDRDGFYRIEGLANDSYTAISRVTDPETGRSMVRHASVHLDDGETVRLDIEIGGSASTKGTVSSPGGYPMTEVGVREPSVAEPITAENMSSRWRLALGMTVCEPDGSYEILDLEAGTYNVTAVSFGERTITPRRIWQASQIVTLEEGQTLELDFAL